MNCAPTTTGPGTGAIYRAPSHRPVPPPLPRTGTSAQPIFAPRRGWGVGLPPSLLESSIVADSTDGLRNRIAALAAAEPALADALTLRGTLIELVARAEIEAP